MFELINKNIKPATISKLIELEEYSFFKSLIESASSLTLFAGTVPRIRYL